MSQRERNDYFKFRQIVKSSSTICGLWFYENDSLLYRLIPYKDIVLCITIMTAVLHFVWERQSNLSIVVGGLNIATAFAVNTFKTSCFLINRKDIKNIQKTLDPYLDEMLQDSKISSLILKNVRIWKFMVTAYSTFIIIVSCISLGLPLFMISYAHYHHVNLTRYPLIYPTSYFWGTPVKGILYKLHFLNEVASAWTLASITLSVDTLYVLYIFQLVGQLRKISYYVTHTNGKSDKKTVLITYVTQYVKLIKCRDSIEKIYGPIVLLVLCISAVVICTLLFQLTHIHSFSGKSIFQGISLCSFLMVKIMQTFMFGYSGSCLTEASEECQYSVLSSDWFGDTKLMSSIVIILSQRPLVLTACNFSVVNVRIFVMIMNTSLSYFFLLMTIEESN